MTARGVVVLAVAAIAAASGVCGACGGRVDGVAGSSSGAPEPTVTGRRPPGGIPTRPPPGPTTQASAAGQIAEAYCKAFSSCCVGAGQPPVDVARCRALTAAGIAPKLDKEVEQLTAGTVAVCVEAIRARMAACGKEDVAWWGNADGRLALFAPSSVQSACSPLTGQSSGAAAAECGGGQACSSGSTCAVDECTNAPRAGESCGASRCVDSVICKEGTCKALPIGAGAGASCAGAEDCQLGFVCFKAQCTTAREHPELYSERHSPYRVGADTCRVFTYL